MLLLFGLRGYCGHSYRRSLPLNNLEWPSQWLPRPLWVSNSSLLHQGPNPLSPRNRGRTRRLFSSSPVVSIRVWPRKPLSLPQGTSREVQRAQQHFNLVRGKTARNTKTHDIAIAHQRHGKVNAIIYQRRRILKHHIPRLQHQPEDGSERGNPEQNIGQSGDGDGNGPCGEEAGLNNTKRTRSLKLGIIRSRRVIPHVKPARPVRRKIGSSSTRFATPSETLMCSLGPLASMYATSKAYTNKVDLSHVDPISVARYGRAGAQNRRQACSSESSHHSTLPSSRRCLQRLLAKYLHSCWPMRIENNEAFGKVRARSANNTALDVVLSHRNVEYIRRKGYEPEDLLSWAWILTANTTDRAIQRLLALGADTNAEFHRSRDVPSFVFLSILRREDWSAAALLKTIVHAWARLEGNVVERRKRLNTLQMTEDPRSHGKHSPDTLLQPMSEQTIVIMVIRLLRQARKVWPEACIPIVAMLTNHVGGERSCSLTASRKPKATARLTFVYNTVLSLIALPMLSPYRSIAFQQRAQFNILRRMNDFNPP